MTELQPDDHAVLQEEGEPAASVPVCVTDQRQPLRVQMLPRKGGATFSKTLTTTPQRLLTADHRRARAQIVATDAASAFLLAFTATAAQDVSTMTVWPGAQPYETTATTEVWAAAASGSFTVGVSTELWAEGE